MRAGLERGREADRPALIPAVAGNFAGVAQRATFGDHCMKNLPLRRDHMLRPFAVLALVVVTSSGSPAAAQDSWPSKPITVIVPFGAGGNTDSLARIYSARLSARLGQQFVIENRVGAGSIIGITSLAKAAPDGYTIGVGTSAGLAINPAIMKENLGYSADKDFAYLHLMAIQPNLLVVHPSVPAKTLPEFIAWVKANPDQAYATSGNGSSQHLCGEMLIQAAGIKMVAVAYRASNQQMQDLVGGQIRIACDNFSSAWEQVKAGKIRALAITSAKRYSFAPDIPTVEETFKGFEVQAWFGWIAPIGAPKIIIDKLTADLYCDLHRLDAALDRRFAQCLRKRIAETIDNFARRAPGGERAPPGVGLETGEATLNHGRNVRQTRNAGHTGLSQPAQLATA